MAKSYEWDYTGISSDSKIKIKKSKELYKEHHPEKILKIVDIGANYFNKNFRLYSRPKRRN